MTQVRSRTASASKTCCAMTRKRTTAPREPRWRRLTAEPAAVAGYLPEQWDRLREISVDRDVLEPTHAEWLSAAESTVSTLIAAGTTVER